MINLMTGILVKVLGHILCDSSSTFINNTGRSLSYYIFIFSSNHILKQAMPIITNNCTLKTITCISLQLHTHITCSHEKSIFGYLYCSSLLLRDGSLPDAPGACFLILFRRIFESSSSEVVRFILEAFADLLFLLCLLFLPLLFADGVGGNGDIEGEDDGAFDGGSVDSPGQLCNALF